MSVNNVIYINDWLLAKYDTHMSECFGYLELAKKTADDGTMNLSHAFTAMAENQKEIASKWKARLKNYTKNNAESPAIFNYVGPPLYTAGIRY